VTTGSTRTVTRTCGLPDIADFVVVLAAVAVLILPDAQKLKVGGLEFERLSSRMEEQTRELQRLSQTVSTTVTVGSDLIGQVRDAFREAKDTLDRVREFLQPYDEATEKQLAAMDRLEQRIDAEFWPDLLAATISMNELSEEAKRRALLGRRNPAEIADDEASAQPARAIISDYLG
jgi:hypothetical protein